MFSYLIFFSPWLTCQFTLPSNFNHSKIFSKIGCTAFTLSGSSAYAGMNADCSNCDNRITFVPGKSYPIDTKRAVYRNTPGFPRMIANDRADLYKPENNPQFNEFQPLGFVDQPRGETFGYWESALPLMNEKGLSFGESSCGTVFQPKPAGKGALLDIIELMRLGLERCNTTRCAIKLMGSLVEKYGYLSVFEEVSVGTQRGNKVAFDDAGEALTMADATVTIKPSSLYSPSG